MTAEQDIAAIADGGDNPPSRVRTALTAVLGRADGPGDFSGASLTKSTNQLNLTSGSTTLITFDGTAYDTDSYFSDANDSLVIPAGGDGFYLVNATASMLDTSNATDVAPDVFVDGSFSFRLARLTSTSGALGLLGFVFSGSKTLQLTAAQEVDLRVFVSGTGVDVRGSETFLQIQRVG